MRMGLVGRVFCGDFVGIMVCWQVFRRAVRRLSSVAGQ